MDDTEIGSIARAYAAERNLIVWESFPWGGATAIWAASQDLEGYLDVLHRVGSQILYLEGDGAFLGFASNGVVHVFPSDEMRQQLTNESEAGERETDDEGIELSVPLPTQAFRDPYYDFSSGRTLDGDLRDLVDTIVADERFDGYQSRRLAAELTANLEVEDAETVRDVATRTFARTVGKELDHRAQQLVAELAADPAFDPLAWGGELHEF